MNLFVDQFMSLLAPLYFGFIVTKSDAAADKAFTKLLRGLQALDNALRMHGEDGPYFLGHQYTLAEVAPSRRISHLPARPPAALPAAPPTHRSMRVTQEALYVASQRALAHSHARTHPSHTPTLPHSHTPTLAPHPSTRRRSRRRSWCE